MVEPTKHQSLFRQAALERIASQERLDVLNDVTTPNYWRGLFVVFGLLLSAILWGIFGSLPVKVRGEGMLIQSGEVSAVTASDPGTVESISVKQGETVPANAVVARLTHGVAVREFNQCVREAAIAKSEEVGAIRGLEGHLASLRQRQVDMKDMIRDGVRARRDLLPIQSEILGTSGDIIERKQRIRALDAKCERLGAMVRDDSVIHAAISGRIIEITVRPGDTVQPGTQILTLEPPGRLQATVYVPARDANRVQVGMQALVSPSHIRPEEDGYMLARVKSRADFPATPEALKKVFRNAGLVERLSSQGTFVRVDLELEADAKSSSGFRWTGKGPKAAIGPGAILTASVIIERRRPISLVVPMVKRALAPG
jgi:HlyD family secretion protein